MVAIIRACEGMVSPSQSVTVSCEDIHIGIPDLLRTKLPRLVNLWDCPDPVVKSMIVGPGDNSRAAGFGGAGSSDTGGGSKRKTRGSG